MLIRFVYSQWQYHSFLSGYAKQVKDIIVFKIGEDWIFLTLLGVIMALLSFGMDWIIGKCQTGKQLNC